MRFYERLGFKISEDTRILKSLDASEFWNSFLAR